MKQSASFWYDRGAIATKADMVHDRAPEHGAQERKHQKQQYEGNRDTDQTIQQKNPFFTDNQRRTGGGALPIFYD